MSYTISAVYANKGQQNTDQSSDDNCPEHWLTLLEVSYDEVWIVKERCKCTLHISCIFAYNALFKVMQYAKYRKYINSISYGCAHVAHSFLLLCAFLLI